MLEFGYITPYEEKNNKERILLSDLCYLLRIEQNKGISLRNLCLFLLTIEKINWRKLDFLENNNSFQYEKIKIISERGCCLGQNPLKLLIENSSKSISGNSSDSSIKILEETSNKLFNKFSNKIPSKIQFDLNKKSIKKISTQLNDKNEEFLLKNEIKNGNNKKQSKNEVKIESKNEINIENEGEIKCLDKDNDYDSISEILNDNNFIDKIIDIDEIYKNLNFLRKNELKIFNIGKFIGNNWEINNNEEKLIASYWELFYLNRLFKGKKQQINCKNNEENLKKKIELKSKFNKVKNIKILPLI